jgi:hypothetical protein
LISAQRQPDAAVRGTRACRRGTRRYGAPAGFLEFVRPQPRGGAGGEG